MERDKTTLRTEKQAHIVTLDEATCFKEREARICEGYRVWHGNGDGVGQAAWREVTPTDMWAGPSLWKRVATSHSCRFGTSLATTTSGSRTGSWITLRIG